MLSLQALYEDTQESLSLRWISSRNDAPRALPEAHEQGIFSSDVVGHLNLIHPRRIHVLGAPEVGYVARMDKARRHLHARELIQGGALGLIVAESLSVPTDWVSHIDQAGIPIFASPLEAADVIDRLRFYLTKALAAHTTLHGVFMDVLGIGVLIMGDSGLGKSELGLELISRGHGLVADDVVDFARVAPDSIEGRCPPLLVGLLEVRGLGLLDIKAIFGETAVRRKMKLRLIVQLRRYSATEPMERLPMADATEKVLGVDILKIVLPVAAGRNLAVLLEAAVRNTILKLRGIDTIAEFKQRQQQAIEQDQP